MLSFRRQKTPIRETRGTRAAPGEAVQRCQYSLRGHIRSLLDSLSARNSLFMGCDGDSAVPIARPATPRVDGHRCSRSRSSRSRSSPSSSAKPVRASASAKIIATKARRWPSNLMNSYDHFPGLRSGLCWASEPGSSSGAAKACSASANTMRARSTSDVGIMSRYRTVPPT